MIHVAKAQKPQVLEDNAEEWTQEYLGLLEAGADVPDRVRYRYRHSDIKTTLRSESSDKCKRLEALVASYVDQVVPAYKGEAVSRDMKHTIKRRTSMLNQVSQWASLARLHLFYMYP